MVVSYNRKSLYSVEKLSGTMHGRKKMISRRKMAGRPGAENGPNLSLEYLQSQCTIFHPFNKVGGATNNWIARCHSQLVYLLYCQSLGEITDRHFSRQNCLRRPRRPIHRWRKHSNLNRISPHRRSTIAAPHNTTQFLMNDIESRYKKCVYSEDSDLFLTTKKDVENFNTNGTVGFQKFDKCCEEDVSSFTDEDTIPYMFDKGFGLAEFERLYNENCIE